MVIFRLFFKRKKIVHRHGYFHLLFLFCCCSVDLTIELVKLSLYDMVGSDILEPGHSTHGCGLHGDSRLFSMAKTYQSPCQRKQR